MAVTPRFTYNVPDGAFRERGVLLEHGYSGIHAFRNRPEAVNRRGEGPIPPGLYMIGEARRSPRVGPVAMNLVPYMHLALGRSSLMIHGDNSRHDASKGCIILSRPTRLHVAQVVADTEGVIFLEVTLDDFQPALAA